MKKEEVIGELIKMAVREHGSKEPPIAAPGFITECEVLDIVIPLCPEGELKYILKTYQKSFCEEE